MFKKLLLAAVLALSVMATPGIARAQSANETEAIAATRDFTAWVQQMLNVMQHANAASENIGGFANRLHSMSNQREARAVVTEFQAETARALSILDAAAAELEALPPYTSNGRMPEFDGYAVQLVSDTRTYLSNLRQMVSLMSGVMTAYQRNDRTEMMRLLPQMENSATILLNGQRTMLRARQHLFRSSETTYHILGAMISMYDGMAAFRVDEDDQRRNAIDAAADSAALWSQSGRLTLATERQNAQILPDTQRTIVLATLDLEEQAFTVDDGVAQFLRANTDMKRDDAGPLIVQMAQFEQQYFSLSQQQVALLQRLTAPQTQ